MKVTKDLYSPLQNKMSYKEGNVEKLIPNLLPKSKYVVHHRLLQEYINLGLKVTNIHRVIEFNEKAWLKSYFDLNTTMRQRAAPVGDSAGVITFKFMNNAIFGKSCENLQKRVNVELID